MQRVRVLLQDALFGKDAESRKSAWDSLLTFVVPKNTDGDGTPLALVDFLTRLKDWSAYKTPSEILLDFRVDAAEPTDWDSAFMACLNALNADFAAMAPLWASESQSRPLTASIVRNIDEMRFADLLV